MALPPTRVMYKVSVVIPIYNVEDYIVRCAGSLFSQTLDEMQFIFIDDASPDNSVALLEQVLERFPQRKPQTIILRQTEHQGLPTARATGLAHVEAPYVAHCDGDDYVEPTMYAKLYENALQNDSDMVICGRIIHYAKGKTMVSFDKPKSKNGLIKNFLYGRLGAVVWCRLTKTDIYRQVQFPTAYSFEDMVQTVQLLTYAKKVSFVHEALYHYCQRPPAPVTPVQQIESLDKLIQQRLSNFMLMHDFIVRHYHVREKDFDLYKMVLRDRYLPLIKDRNIRKKYFQTFPEINFRLLFNRNVPLIHRGGHLLVLLRLYPLIRPAYDFIKRNSFVPSDRRRCDKVRK